jgi:hypothetical protein
LSKGDAEQLVAAAETVTNTKEPSTHRVHIHGLNAQNGLVKFLGVKIQSLKNFTPQKSAHLIAQKLIPHFFTPPVLRI